MNFTSTIPVPRLRCNGSPPLSTTDPVLAEAERIIGHLIRRGVIRAESRAANHLRSIFAAPPEALRVDRIARRIYCDRATLARHLCAEGLPAPRDWIMLARALYAHRTFLRGGTLQRAACAAGYPDTFAMSNVFHRITGLRPSYLRDVDQAGCSTSGSSINESAALSPGLRQPRPAPARSAAASARAESLTRSAAAGSSRTVGSEGRVGVVNRSRRSLPGPPSQLDDAAEAAGPSGVA